MRVRAIFVGIALTMMSAAPASAATLASFSKVSAKTSYTSSTISWSLSKGATPKKYAIRCTSDTAATISKTGTKSPVRLTKLQSNTAYKCTLTSTLNDKKRIKKFNVKTLTYTAPLAPTSISAISADGRATVTWSPPSLDGGSPVVQYRVSSLPASNGCVTTTTTCEVAGLVNGVAYSFVVQATNAYGTSIKSVPSSSTTPHGLINTMSNIHAVPGNGYVDVTWDLNAHVDGVALSWGDNHVELAGNPTNYRFTNLTNCSAQDFLLQTKIGESKSNAITTSATPGVGIAVPDSVRNLTTTVGNSHVEITFDAPSYTGGAGVPITEYEISINDGQQSVTRSISPAEGATHFSSDFTELTNGTTYTFQVVAANNCGTRMATSDDRVSGTPQWPGNPIAIVDLSNPDVNSQITLSAGQSVAYQFTALDIFDAANQYFALQPQCSGNATVWADCQVSVSVTLFTIGGEQLDAVQYSYSSWNGIGVIPVRPSTVLVQDAEYVMVVTLTASSATYTSIDVLSTALVW